MKYITQICRNFTKGGAELLFQKISSDALFQGDIRFRQSICLDKNRFDPEFARTFRHPVYVGNFDRIKEAIDQNDIILFWGDLKLNESNLPKPKICIVYSCTEDPLIIQNNSNYITHAITTSKKTASITCNNVNHIISYPRIDHKKLQTNIDRQKFREKLGLKNTDFVLGMIARIGDTKRQRWLIDAILRIKDDSVKAIFVGEGNNRKYLQSISYPHGIFVGHQDNVGDWYQVFDAYCILSRNEGGPLTLFESFYMNVPVIHTQVGITEELCNCTNSFLVKDEEELVNVINHVRKIDKTALKLYTDNAYKIYERHGKIEDAISEWYKYFKTIVTQNTKNLL